MQAKARVTDKGTTGVLKSSYAQRISLNNPSDYTMAIAAWKSSLHPMRGVWELSVILKQT
jgi:hypothetical protein